MPRESLRLQDLRKSRSTRSWHSLRCPGYKQAGNSVTVTVIEAIGRRILAVDEEPRKMGDAA